MSSPWRHQSPFPSALQHPPHLTQPISLTETSLQSLRGPRPKSRCTSGSGRACGELGVQMPLEGESPPSSRQLISHDKFSRFQFQTFCGKLSSLKTLCKIALARWLSQLGHHPVHQKVAGSIPGQGTHVGGRFNPL